MYCPHCGRENEDGSSFCEHCGKSLAAEGLDDYSVEADWEEDDDLVDDEARQDSEKKGGGKKVALIAIAVVAVIAIVALTIVCGGGVGKKADVPAPAASEQPQTPTSEASTSEEESHANETATPAEHTLAFETAGGTAIDEQTVKTGDVVPSPENPTKDGSEFGGWYFDQGLTANVSFPYTVKETDPETIVFYAKWSESSSNVNPTYAGGTVPSAAKPRFPYSIVSSELPGDEIDPDYGAGMAHDGNLNTAWNEGSAGDGTGEWIEIYAMEKQRISGIRIAAGFQKSASTYYQNRRPQNITLTLDDGSNYYAILDDVYGYQSLEFDKPVETKSLRITINSTYAGTDFNDCCISEVEEF